MPRQESEIYVDDKGRLRHTNCFGRACHVPNCRESLVATANRDGSINLPDTFREQVIVDRRDDA